MNIKHLQYFIEVNRLNSFTRAAEHLFITQPTISKMIKNLETELGVTLFDRSQKKLILTDAGKVILEQAKIIDKAFENLQVELNNLVGLKKGMIRLGLPPILDSSYIPKLIGKFHDKYPEVAFHLIEDGSKKIEDYVANDELDIGVVVLPTKNDLFHHLSLLKEQLMLVVPYSHSLANQSAAQLSDLKDEPFILFNDDFVLHDRIISSLNSVGFRPQVISESSQWSYIEEMVSCNLGVTVLPESICKQLKSQVRSINIVNPSINWHLAIIWKKDQYLSHAAKEWIHFIKNQLSANAIHP
ncbi:cidABC operon transcriptional activator CidR [Bacillus sp. 03113]|uniref:cidABC operon transcriptional activator CidR n=1 Tax=Bacillus sp. 03113 TaxID=2578211 RepID=UPI0011441205|nr:LysR family transcriptional regulator [Bacillus sp. 03113]